MVTLILAAWSTSYWFGLAVVGTVDSQILWVFLKLLEIVLKENYGENWELSTIVLDNSRTFSYYLLEKIALPMK